MVNLIWIQDIMHYIYSFFQVAAVDPPPDARTKAICDNIDAWALWVSPPVFILFNIAYWFAYQHVEAEPPELHILGG